MSTSDPSEEKELSLVGKVELRIALTDTEDKLQSLLGTYLCPLLLKLASPYKSVKDKVISICQHINTRTKSKYVKNDPDIPCKENYRFGEQFKKTSNATVRHFDLLYIEQGLERLPQAERIGLVPIILQGLSANYKDSPRNTAVLFNIFLRLLQQYPLPSRGSKEDRELRSEWRLNDDTQDGPFIAGWIGKFMLFNDSATLGRPSGLSENEADFLKLHGKDSTWQPRAGGLSLADTKLQAARLLWTAAFTPTEKFIPALLAAGSTNTRLSEIGDEILKTNLQAVSLEDSEEIKKLYSLILGEQGYAGKSTANPILKGKILRLLCKSKEATTFADSITALTRQELRAPDADAAPRSSYDRGLEASKLRKEVFSFVIWIARMASKLVLGQIAPAIVADLRSYIETQGWPTINDGSSLSGAQELISRQRGYESIGLLAQACPQSLLLQPDLELLRWLFQSLVADVSDKETSMSIETTLAIIMHAFDSSMTTELEAPLAELLLSYAELKIGDADSSGTEVKRSPRFVAVRFANRCFPFDNLSARWMDLIALSDARNERPELIEEGTRGLDPYWFQIMNPADSTKQSAEEVEAYISRKYRLPEPEDAISYLFGTQSRRGSLGQAFIKSVLFCRNTLYHRALSSRDLEPTLNQDWERSLDALALLDEKGRRAIADYLEEGTSSRNKALLVLCDNAFEAFVTSQNTDGPEAGSSLRDIVSLGPASIRQTLAHRSSELLPKIYGSDSIARSEASQMFALTISSENFDSAERDKFITDMLQKATAWPNAIGGVVHQVCGAALCLTYSLCQLNSTSTPLTSLDEIQKQAVTLMLSIIFEARDQDLLQTALTSVDQMCVHGLLTEKTLPDKFTIGEFLDKLTEFAKSGKETAVACLGHFAMQCSEKPDDSVAWTIFQKLEGLNEVRQPELHFSVGSALSSLAIGWSSRSLIRYLDVKHPRPTSMSRDILLGKVLDKVLDDCAQTKPSLRQAAAVWLLCLLQDCSNETQIHTHLRAIHTRFRALLSDRSTLNQETASRGLALVYEKGDQDTKDELIRDLVRSFTSNKSNLAGTVSEDTELFDAGALPTGDGSVTTYKDIVDLATEVGDPSLVYKFMAMASSSAIWSSRAAFGRFGLSKVLADASGGGYLAQNPKLYSTLYRYRFDPNSGVRISMNEIWSSLVPDSQNVIELHFDQILEDLLKNILGKEWRTRQACCAAMADLVQSKPIARYAQHLADIWNAAFKVCDDIKGSVRKAAMELVKALTGLLTRNLEHGDAATSNSMLKQVVPFLCGPQGLEAAASDIRIFALSSILDIIKKGSPKALQPYLGEMIAGHLLPSFTSIEPDVVNYAYMKPDNFNLTTEQIDKSRLNSVKLSPMMEAIERCLDMIDADSMKDLSRLLAESMKSLIGVPSKIGAARVIVTLSTKHNVAFRPHADQFLRLLRKQTLDRNETISTSAAAACGYLARVVSDNTVLDHVNQVKAIYFRASEEKSRFAAADLTCTITKYATDRAHSFASELFPFIFLGMHDTDEGTAAEFKKAWEEMSGGSRTIRLYLKEISELVMSHVDSTQWAYKHASSLATAEAVTLLGQKIANDEARIIWPPLDKALSAKTWKGKEKVLLAFVSFVQHAAIVDEDAIIRDRCRIISMREARRNNTGLYRQQAVKSLGQYIQAVQGVDWYEPVSGIVLPIIESLVDDAQAMEIDDDATDQRTARAIREETLGNSVRTLLASIDPKTRQGTQLNESFTKAAATMQALCRQHGVLVDNTMLEATKELMQRLIKADGSGFATPLLLDILPSLDSKEQGVEMTRVKSAEVVEAMAKIAEAKSEVRVKLLEAVETWIAVDRSQAVHEILLRAKQALSV